MKRAAKKAKSMIRSRREAKVQVVSSPQPAVQDVARRVGWNDLFVSGSIVDLSISIWRASMGINAKDLGIENSTEVARVLSLGRYRLAPASAFEKVNEITRAAMRHWNYYSLNFGLIPGARYVPDASRPKLVQELRREKARFDEAVEEFLSGYQTMKDEMLPQIEKALKDASRDEEAAKQAYNRIELEYPTVDTVRGKFKLSWSIYAITSPKSQAAADAAEDETESIKDVVKGMVTQLRDDMGTKLSTILATVYKGGTLKSNAIQSAYDILDRVDSLNIMGDQVLADQSQKFREMLKALEGGKRVSDGELANLEDIQKTLDTSLADAVKAAEESLTGLGRRKLGV